MPNIRRVLVANRGEIAVRVIRACQEVGIETVLAASEPDLESLPAQMAGRVVCIGPAPSAKSYLSVGTIVTAALGTGADAIHPGYGFLAEQPELADACEENGVIFIGPNSGHIRLMGDKIRARKIAKDLGVPVVPGSELIRDVTEAMTVAESLGFPILLKAAAGGGGKGIKIVYTAAEIEAAYNEAAAEARAAFGDDRLYLEHAVTNARHIEIQILADSLGNMVHLFERDCSVQRRRQKIVEEAPSSVLSDELRRQMCQAALQIAAAVHYENAGTVEFLLDQDREEFYFLEMNTRIQVEHPVTERITGVDLVKEQIRIASGDALSFTQTQVNITGHAIECRVNAELPGAGFRPSPGQITQWQPPEGAGIRVDTHCFPGYRVPPYYDSLLAKLIVTGNTRAEAIELMRHSLANFSVSGVDTTIDFLGSLMGRPDYINGRINTVWLEQNMPGSCSR
jgi:acetyl-CoA carboxylase biotin carboxylase subunit